MFLCMMLYLVDRHGGIEGASMCCVKGESGKTLHGSGSGGEQDPTDRAGSLSVMEDGAFAVGCLHPEDIAKNQARLHLLGPDFRLVRTVVLDNFEIPLGIETIKYRDGELYLSCYKGGSGLLVVLNAQTFTEKRRQKFNGATGLVFDGPYAWRGRTVQDVKTKKWKSSLIRCEAPKGVR